MTEALNIRIDRAERPVDDARRDEILADPGFGQHFTDHMFIAHWTPDALWHDASVSAYAPIPMDPASAVLHYAQEIFEGLKAYRHRDGSIWTFRPEVNAARIRRSAARLALPDLAPADFIGAVDALIRTDRAWVPSGDESEGEKSLYIRPFMFASEVFLGVRPARHVTFCVIASPAGAYFTGGLRPVNMWLSEDYTRAAPGGTGAAKCGGNYAASLLAQQEASANGCEQVVFLDAVEKRWVEELGGMNIFFVHADGSIVTPQLTDSILEGVTRASIIELGQRLGHKVEERKVDVDEWRDGVISGEIAEVFACGTAAVLTSVGTLRWRGGEATLAGGVGPVTTEIREQLIDVQYGRAEDSYGWMHRVV
jgi:branched-chain amino acid aminotransferase